MSELIVPGKWKCDKCAFVLIKSAMHAHTGQVAPDYDPKAEPCPNHQDGTMMRAYTWKEEAADGDRALDRMLEECDAAGALIWNTIDAIDALSLPSERISQILTRLRDHLDKHHISRPAPKAS